MRGGSAREILGICLQRKVRFWFAVGMVLVLTGLYLGIPARNEMHTAATLVLLTHIFIGLLVFVPAVLVLWHRWKTEPQSRRFWFAVGALTTACALPATYLVVKALLGRSVASDGFANVLHWLSGGIVCLLFVGRLARYSKTRVQNSLPTAPKATVGVIILLSCGQLGLFGASIVEPRYLADQYYQDLTATNAAQANNPLFPAEFRIQHPNGSPFSPTANLKIPESASCGRTGCHPSYLHEWKHSAHGLAGKNPLYLKAEKQYRAKSGDAAARWCQGCHSPTKVLNLKDNEGVGCYACHATSGHPTRTGNGRFLLEPPKAYPFAEASEKHKQQFHDFLMRLRPGPHQRAYLKPNLHTSAEFCSGCHRQSFGVSQNQYQFVRGPDTWGEWHSGVFAGRAARVADETRTKPKTCQQCHFPRTADGRAAHRSPGANTALSMLRGSVEQTTHIQNFMQNRLKLDIFLLRPASSGQNVSEWVVPLEAPSRSFRLTTGTPYLLDVVVTNRDVGHAFPGGYTDSKEVWLEITLEDSRGFRIGGNGLLSEAIKHRQLPLDTHRYTQIALDNKGGVINDHNHTEQVTTLFRRSIAPNGSDIARYRFQVPKARANGSPLQLPLRIKARLCYRAVRFREYPDRSIPITILAEATTVLESKKAKPLETLSPEERALLGTRFLEYGEGLLTSSKRPEVTAPLYAFRKAERLLPNLPEPTLGLGRVYLAEPYLLQARTQFEKALKLTPEHPAALAYLGVVLNKQGQHKQATALLQPLTLRYPQDATLQFDYGIALFKSGRYEEAAQAFERSLASDPDNAATHFQLQRCYIALRRFADARQEDSILRYLSEDRLAARLIPAYLSKHPEVRPLLVPIPEHSLR